MDIFSRTELLILRRIIELVECSNLLHLADELKISYPSAQQAVKRLEKKGILDVQRKSKGNPLIMRLVRGELSRRPSRGPEPAPGIPQATRDNGGGR